MQLLTTGKKFKINVKARCPVRYMVYLNYKFKTYIKKWFWHLWWQRRIYTSVRFLNRKGFRIGYDTPVYPRSSSIEMSFRLADFYGFPLAGGARKRGSVWLSIEKHLLFLGFLRTLFQRSCLSYLVSKLNKLLCLWNNFSYLWFSLEMLHITEAKWIADSVSCWI